MKRRLFAAVTLLLLIALVACGGKTVDVDKLYTITANGANGYGSVNVSENPDYLFDISLDAAGIKKDDANVIDALNKAHGNSESLEKLNSFISTISYKLDDEVKNGNLKNGDTVIVHISASDDVAKSSGYKLSSNEVKYKIDGLKEATKIDPFEGVEINYQGYHGKAKASLNQSK